MSDANPKPKATPGRHRQRKNGRTAAQKAYASENDVGSFDAGHYHRGPHTPNKALSGSPAPGSHSSVQTGSRGRNRNKGGKGKAGHVSPDLQQDRNTPTARRASTSVKSGMPAAAFAGATFHASPAPSALPIPSFLSKPSNESPATAARQMYDSRNSPPTTDTEAAGPYSSSAPRANESPLDFMFRAHRQEKERQFGSPRHDSQASPSFFGAGPSHSPQVPQTAPPTLRYSNSGGIDRAELDGTPSHEIGPAFSTPYHERIRAARATRGDAPPVPSAQNSLPNNTSTDDATAALKKFLFGGPQQAAKSPLAAAPSAQPPAAAYQQPAGQAPTTGHGRGNNIQAMENDLRRILKLDSSSS